VLPLASPVTTILPARLNVTACTPWLSGSVRFVFSLPVAASYK
jgi:hypothetical protein